MANFNRRISDTALRIGEVRFYYCNVFSPRKKKDGTDDKFSIQLLIPKADAAAKAMIDAAIEAAKAFGVSSKWNGKLPPASKLKLPLRDGDEEFPDDENYEGMWFLNASSPIKNKPGLRVLEGGQIVEALDEEDIYSGCYGCAAINFYPFSSDGNVGIACGLNNLIKTRDGEKLGGAIRSAEQDFADLGGMACLD